ncbi:hypothetical protein [Sulfobacillus harzensis]|uniref:Uncharacterized protein n=1 Tax=Sulfobacillus harzensis TaxID=2729629 RepID=A0A7Y0L8M6_9FIRM|nr:hypothetical protein [Sulfobacillus harzensis]NMP24836.1 hypothetical protein [Sulfobacillus harzensis]
MADEKPSPVIILPRFPEPGAERLARHPGRRTGLPETLSKTLTPGLAHHGQSPTERVLRAIRGGQRMAYHIARWVAEPGLARPVNHVFDAYRVGAAGIHWLQAGFATYTISRCARNRAAQMAAMRAIWSIHLLGVIHMGNTEKGMPRELGPEQVRLMQGLAQEVTIRRPEVLEGGATVGELAWQFGKDRAAIGDRWRYRLWPRADGSGRLDAWAWMYLPHTVRRTDGSTSTSTSADLIWQVHPDRPELLDEILDWYAAQAAGLDRFITPQDADTELLARLAARGYTRDSEAGGDDGDWHQFNRRTLVNLAEPVLPAGFRFRTAAEVGSAAATRAHVDAWYPSTFTET